MIGKDEFDKFANYELANTSSVYLRLVPNGVLANVIARRVVRKIKRLHKFEESLIRLNWHKHIK